MNKNYKFLKQSSNEKGSLQAFKGYLIIAWMITLFLSSFDGAHAQETFTLGSGTESYNHLGVSPFATINRNSRSQYMYYAEELYNAGFDISGNVVSLAINVTSIGLPLTMKPENIKIKIGMTTSFDMGPGLVDNLPVYYESSVENITELGWHIFTLDTPFAWDGFRNIIIEICRSNAGFGTSFSVEGTEFSVGELVSAANYTNETGLNGCSLPNENLMPTIYTRRRPNMQFTMTNPCEATPAGGQTVVSAGPYCNGEAFVLSVQNGSIESGLSYQWQSSPNENGPWTDIADATDAFLVTSQSIATYYRRATTCDAVFSTVFDLPVFVGGEGCYCTSLVTNENSIGITNVVLGDINSSSVSTPAYTNFTAMQTELERATTTTLSVNVNTTGGTNYTRAWIDWNQNGEFESDEAYDLGVVTGGTNVNSGVVATIEVPVDAVLGSTIMRVRTAQSAVNAYPTACESIDNGEAEDYTIVITENLSIGDYIPVQNNLLVAINGDIIRLKSTTETIQKIDFYDISGRLVLSKQGLNDVEVSISDFNPQKQLWIVRTTLTTGQQIAVKINY